jgi:DNA repair protein SbcC/Rad50
MRPRELTISGFRSYAEETKFDWTGRSLVGIVGPIGSGKSSILDAIAFALYGRTPRIESAQKSLINQRRDSLQVSLTFDVDGTQWRAIRVLRRTGAAAHTLLRIEGEEEVVVTDKAREMGERIEALLGLDFEAFRRSVLLAQNQFANFLEATGTARNQVLKGVFGFDRLDAMRAEAKTRLEVLERNLATLEGRRATAETDARDLETKRGELATAEGRAEALESLRRPFEEAKQTIKVATERASGAGQRLARLDELSERIPDQERAEKVFGSAGEAGGQLAAAEAELETATATRAEAVQRSELALSQVGGRQGLDEIADLVGQWRAQRDRVKEAGRLVEARASGVAQARDAAASQESALVVAAAAQTEAAGIEGAARTAVTEARARLLEAQQTHRAHAVRTDLTVGEPCPVCTQVVAELPSRDTPASLESREQELVVAEARLQAAAETARATASTLAAIRAESGSQTEAAAAAQQQLTEVETGLERDQEGLGSVTQQLSTRLGEGDPEQLLSNLREGVEETAKLIESATTDEHSKRARLRELQETAAGAQEAVSAMRTELATMSGLLDLPIRVDDSTSSVQQALVVLREGWIAQRQSATGEQTKASEEAAAASLALKELLEAAGLGDNDDVVEVIAAARQERTAKEAEVQLLEKRLKDLAELVGEEVELVAAAEVLRRLHADLAPSKFLEFVLDERRRALGDLASEHLETLSAGRYRFDESGDFQIVDLTAADAIRAPASLSGGETFLASLALALALAEIVAREGGRLDAFFLDEGFGSLDPEHLDLAMDGIERLVTTGPDRLVVIVSHVPALRDRVEDLVVLDRDAVTGDTRVVAGATGA